MLFSSKKCAKKRIYTEGGKFSKKNKDMTPDFLKTDRKESFSTWRFRTFMNWYPMYFGTGGKIIFWAADGKELHIRLRLNLWTYNLVGTMFGGSLFAAADPFYMVLLKKILGEDYVVWDKSASIRFIKPGKTTLFAKYELEDDTLNSIIADVKEHGEIERNFTINWLDKDGKIHAKIERNCYIADKAFYENKKGVTQKMRFK
jgi:acyl-coenzyme A thioesterase PaaI-like protein